MESPQPKKKRISLKKIGIWIKDKSIHFLVAICIFLLIMLAFSDQVFITVESGERGVLFRRFANGTVTDTVYGEGMKIVAPWNTLYRYNIRQQTITNCIHVLSTNGLSISIELATRFHPNFDSLGVIHAKLGPEYPVTVIVPEVESSVRKIISKYEPHDFYTIKRDSIEAKVLADTKDEFGELDIIVHDIMIKDISLPRGLESAIENKLIEEQKSLAYEYILSKEEEEAKRKLIEAKGIKSFVDSSGISILQWKGIDATKALANSPNSKVVIIGTQEGDLPIILGGQ